MMPNLLVMHLMMIVVAVVFMITALKVASAPLLFFLPDVDEVQRRVEKFMSATTLTYALPIAEALINTKYTG